MSDAINEIIERISAIISGLGFLLPFAIVLILRMFSGKSKSPEQGQGQGQPPQPRPKPVGETIPGFPFAPPAWMEMGHPTARQQPESQPPAWREPVQPSPWREPAHPPNWREPVQPSPWREPVQPANQWGHAFDRNDDRLDDALKWGSAFDYEDGEPVRWGSAFDAEYGQTKYGFEKATWGNTFPKKSSEPIVHFG